MRAVGGWRCHNIKQSHINRAKRFILDHGFEAVQRMYGLNIPESVELALNDMGYVVISGVIIPEEEYYDYENLLNKNNDILAEIMGD
jgi:hypothetical protein